MVQAVRIGIGTKEVSEAIIVAGLCASEEEYGAACLIEEGVEWSVNHAWESEDVREFQWG